MADQQPDEQGPAVPRTPAADGPTISDGPRAGDTSPSRRRRLRAPSRRTALAGLALSGVTLVGFGGGYLLGQATGGGTDQIQMTGFERGERMGTPPDGMSRQAPGGEDGRSGTGEQPDFDGDGQPDSDGSSTPDGGTTTPDDGASASSSADDTSTT